MQIVPARASDERAIRGLLESAGLPSGDITTQSLAGFLVVHDESRVVGVIGLDLGGETALLRSLAVNDSARKSGIGARLVEAAEALARARGVLRLYLLTTTASNFFLKRGYAIVDRDAAPSVIRQTPRFRTLCPASSSLMEKVL